MVYQDVLLKAMPKTFFTAIYQGDEVINGTVYEIYRLKSKFELNSRFMLINPENGEVKFENEPFEVIVDYPEERFDLSKFDKDAVLSYLRATEVRDETAVEIGVRIQLRATGGRLRFFLSGGNMNVEKLIKVLRRWEKVLEVVEGMIGCQSMEAVEEEESLSQS